jgi:3-(methylsulfanyl)propanoyl-CoA dehydrogenase
VNKLATARFFTKRLLPRYISLSESVKGGADCLYAMEADQF